MSTQYTQSNESAASAAKGYAHAAEEKLTDAAEQVQAFAQDQYDGFTVAIRRNPLQAAGIAMGVGFALALLARR